MKHATRRLFDFYPRMVIKLVKTEGVDVLKLADQSGVTIYDVGHLWLARQVGARLSNPR